MDYENENEEESKESKAEKEEEILDRMRQRYQECTEYTNDQRQEALDTYRFVMMDEQWPEAAKRQRELEGRPCMTINKLKPFVRQVVNDARQNKPAIVVHPADSTADPETAEIFMGLIRNIEAASSADVAYDTAVESAVTMGIGFIRVNVDYSYDDTFDMDVKIQRVLNPLSVHGDIASTACDSSDWRYAFVDERKPKEDYETKYKNAEKVDWESSEFTSLSNNWISEKTITIVEYWERNEVMRGIVRLSTGEVVGRDVYDAQAAYFEAIGAQIVDEREVPSYEVIQYIANGVEILETNKWLGKYIPIIPVYGEEICVEGERIFRGLVHSAKDAQMNFNYWRTASTELVALAPKAPFIGPIKAFEEDADKWATANTANHAYIAYGGDTAPQRQPFAGVPAGALQEAMNSSDDMKAVIGMYDASLGARSNETSGVAIMARQREGDVSTFHFTDNLRRAIRCVGMVVIDIIPPIYSGERVVRVLGPDNKEPKNQQLGTPTVGPDGIERIYDLGVGKYDLTVSSGPSFTSRREEAAVQMMEFVRAFPAAAPLIGDLLANNLDWPGADEMAKRMKAMLPPQLQEGGQNPEVQGLQQQMQQMQQMMQQQMQQAQQAMQDMQQKLQQAELKLQGTQADKAIEAQKLQIDEYNAETNRIKAIQTGMTPEEIQILILQTLQNMQQLPTDGNMVQSQPQMQPQMQDLSAMQPQQPDQWQQMPAPTNDGVQ
jgi:hypothetical protein